VCGHEGVQARAAVTVTAGIGFWQYCARRCPNVGGYCTPWANVTGIGERRLEFEVAWERSIAAG
jgi:hypothetical protein